MSKVRTIVGRAVLSSSAVLVPARRYKQQNGLVRAPHYGKLIYFWCHIQIDQYDRLATIRYDYAGDPVEAKFKIALSKGEGRKRGGKIKVVTWKLWWICRCRKSVRLLYLDDDGRLGCRQCGKIPYPQMPANHRRMVSNPEALIAYMKSARYTKQKVIAMRLFKLYVARTKKAIMREP